MLITCECAIRAPGRPRKLHTNTLHALMCVCVDLLFELHAHGSARARACGWFVDEEIRINKHRVQIHARCTCAHTILARRIMSNAAQRCRHQRQHAGQTTTPTRFGCGSVATRAHCKVRSRELTSTHNFSLLRSAHATFAMHAVLRDRAQHAYLRA